MKKSGNFKTNIPLDSIESFLNYLSSNKVSVIIPKTALLYILWDDITVCYYLFELNLKFQDKVNPLDEAEDDEEKKITISKPVKKYLIPLIMSAH